WTVGTTWRISERIIDEARFNWTQNAGSSLFRPTSFGGAVPYSLAAVLPSQYAPPGSSVSYQGGIMFIADPVLGTLQFSSPGYQNLRARQKQLNFVDSLTWVRGHHSYKFGSDFRSLHSILNNGQYVLGPSASSISSVHNGIADFVAVQAGQPGS